MRLRKGQREYQLPKDTEQVKHITVRVGKTWMQLCFVYDGMSKLKELRKVLGIP